jgi:hypothetical protein
MATEAKTAQQGEQEAEERAKADEMLNKTLSCLDAMSKRMDAWEAKMDAEEEAKKKEEEKADAIDKNPTKGDGARVRHDNAVTQARADAICNEWGTAAPRPLDGEATRDYKVRLLGEFKQNSPVWRDVELTQIAALPAEVFDGAESQIYADSMAASAHPVVPDGELRSITRRMKGDATGRMETVHFGRPSAWMSQFAHRRLHARINPRPNSGDR